MSNDIPPGKLAFAPTRVTAPQPARATEATKPLSVKVPEPAVEAKVDPHEALRTLQEASEQLNKQMAKNGRDLSFRVDDVAKVVVVTVKNREGDVVRQIPNEVVIRLAHNLENMKGLMQDDKS